MVWIRKNIRAGVMASCKQELMFTGMMPPAAQAELKVVGDITGAVFHGLSNLGFSVAEDPTNLAMVVVTINGRSYNCLRMQMEGVKISPAAPVVQQIFRWHAEGYGAARISRMLNEQGIPNPRKQQELDGLRKKYMYSPGESGRWSNTTIGDILNNPAYCGDVVQHTKEKVSYKSRVVRRVCSDARAAYHP